MTIEVKEMLPKINALVSVVELSKNKIGLGTLKEIQSDLLEQAAFQEKVEAQIAAMTWQDRVNVEYSNLNLNIEKLQEALKNKSVLEESVPILKEQETAMIAYRDILRKRVTTI